MPGAGLDPGTANAPGWRGSRPTQTVGGSWIQASPTPTQLAGSTSHSLPSWSLHHNHRIHTTITMFSAFAPQSPTPLSLRHLWRHITSNRYLWGSNLAEARNSTVHLAKIHPSVLLSCRTFRILVNHHGQATMHPIQSTASAVSGSRRALCIGASWIWTDEMIRTAMVAWITWW